MMPPSVLIERTPSGGYIVTARHIGETAANAPVFCPNIQGVVTEVLKVMPELITGKTLGADATS